MRHGIAEQMAFLRRAYADIVLLGRDPMNLGYRKEKNAAARLENDAFCVVVRFSGLRFVDVLGPLYLRLGVFDGVVQSLAGERLQQIVGGVNLKGFQRVMI